MKVKTIKPTPKFWDHETMVIKDDPVDKKLYDKQMLEQFDESIKFRDGRYEIKLPRKFDNIDLPNNYDVAKRRIEYLVRRFRKNPSLFKDYKAVINEYLTLGIVEIVEPQELNSSNENVTYYLPHHPVIRKDKQTTNLRVISLSENDRDLTRFLWVDQLPNDQDNSMKLEILRMTRVLFGVTSSPFLLGAVIRHHVRKFEIQYPETSSMISTSMYVDDLLLRSLTVENTLNVAKESSDIFLKANMLLRKWQSNSPELREHLRSLKFDICERVNANPFKILGLIWDIDHDLLRIDNQNLCEFVNCQEKTKRTIIQATGIKKVTRGLRKKWDNWCEQLQYLNTIKVPRCYFHDFQGNYDSIEIHCFCDASEKAFGSVIFLRFTIDEKVRTAFLTSKSRLAPIKRMTLPRLELMGAVVGARLINRVLSVLKLDAQTYLWTDSNIVLHWVKSSFCTWKPFVSNRIVEIQNLTNPKDWRHCRGRDNPADRLTRGITIKDLENDELWWFGPS
ncbi:reverse transcriptase [Caerostris extrusa]|uniref:Reverse transcriptase n=1 Tax=Caerostris extrusa TaxID=172846 RepID=A0AAV4U2S8_CAEEX|nr:reverse transcriptase [Caerostris extrusa]